MAGADHLARIFGTEEDKVNCPFYYKVGACRHGEQCSRHHVKPGFSQTLLIPHMYQISPPGPDGKPLPDDDRFSEFQEEVHEELSNYGRIEELNVCENLGDHLMGNLYVKYSKEEEAEKALKALNGRFYAGKVVVPEYSPVSDFKEARCRQFEEEFCTRGGYCNFMHLKRTPAQKKALIRELQEERSNRRKGPPADRDRRDRDRGDRDRDRGHRDRDDRRRRRSRSRSRDRRRRSRSRDRRRRSRSRDRRRSRSRVGKKLTGGATKTILGRDKDTPKERVRETSEERRAKIASWNLEREQKMNQDKKDETVVPNDDTSQ